MKAFARTLAIATALALAACSNPNTSRMQGWIEGDFVFVGPDEIGRVETLNVREGDQVASGAPLFAVDADLQKTDVSNAIAQVAEAKARLARQEAAQQRKEEIAVLRAQENRAPPKRGSRAATSVSTATRSAARSRASRAASSRRSVKGPAASCSTTRT